MLDGSDIGVSLGQNNEIESAGQFGLRCPKGFADLPFPTVADDGVADLFGNGQSQSAVRQTVRSGKQNDCSIGGGVPESEHILKLFGVAQTQKLGETIGHVIPATAGVYKFKCNLISTAGMPGITRGDDSAFFSPNGCRY